MDDDFRNGITRYYIEIRFNETIVHLISFHFVFYMSLWIKKKKKKYVNCTRYSIIKYISILIERERKRDSGWERERGGGRERVREREKINKKETVIKFYICM